MVSGNNGIHYLVQVVNKLLDPKTSEHTAAFVGRLVAVVIGRCGTSLGENLDLMLRSVLSKMQQTETLSVMQVSRDVHAFSASTYLPAFMVSVYNSVKFMSFMLIIIAWG